ncbi:MAG: manganese catalase family protein [Pyrinomonadaceae bacterium]|nr:manganese catalase family protein [Pyrinomonadaceae bacterium]
MYLRIAKLQIELPMPKKADPDAAAAVQDLLGGRFGEMSTLMNYTYQSFNFRNRDKLKPFYDLIANIAAEEMGHIELVSATINGLLVGTTKADDPTKTPLAPALDVGNLRHFLDTSQASFCGDPGGKYWTGDYVFSSGNLVLDLLHNFFLENGARMHKLRCYEMTDNPVAREMVGYLLVRGGVHALAYAKALEEATGVDVKKMMPIPNIQNSKFPEARKFEQKGYHRNLYRFTPGDYVDVDKIWKGTHPDDGQSLQVVEGPPEGGEIPVLPEVPEQFAPDYDPAELFEIAKRLMKG